MKKGTLEDDFHIIQRKINLDLFLDHSRQYYNQVKYDLRRKVKEVDYSKDEIFIIFNYTDDFELWVARTFMTLQRGIVPNVSVPSGINKEDVEDWLKFFRPQKVYFQESKKLYKLDGDGNEQ